MGEFFYGCRRKVGCITLVMACVLCGGWIRSYETSEFVELNGRPWRYGVESIVGHVCFIQTTPITPGPLFDFDSEPTKHLANVEIDDRGIPKLDFACGVTAELQFDWCGFHVSDGTTDRDCMPFKIQRCIIPYWFFVLTLTLVSAYLLVWKPRKSAKPRRGSDRILANNK